MAEVTSHTTVNDWQKQAEQYLISENYSAAISLYEQAIEEEPDIISHYWNLGLMLLLQGQEAEAQMTWFMALSEAGEEELHTRELIEVLETEVERRLTKEDYQVASAICQHIREIAPENINNLLYSVEPLIKLETFHEDGANLLVKVRELLSIQSADDQKDLLQTDLLLNTIITLLTYVPSEPLVFDFIEYCLKHSSKSAIMIDIIMIQSVKIAAGRGNAPLAVRFAELCLEKEPKHLQVILHLAHFYIKDQQYKKALETAKLCYETAGTLAEKTYAHASIVTVLISSGSSWDEIDLRSQQQISLTKQLVEEKIDGLDAPIEGLLIGSLFFLPYTHDNPENNRWLHNGIGRLCQTTFLKHNAEVAKSFNDNLLSRKSKINLRESQKRLNIGYVSHCFKQHSVGWLSRWLFQYHNSEKFKIHCYYWNDNDSGEVNTFTRTYFVDKSAIFYKIGDIDKMREQIQKDEIDILIDLDSITLDVTCMLLLVKCAPIQVTWLGWDASGLPLIDYFIADPYVLPESAQSYYSETIWRLPQTYIAVDGFEVGLPNLRREHLDIPSDAIVYLMSQKGYKRNVEHLRLQMKIIKEVPNSYLLIKGDADSESTKAFFERIAEEVGVECSRLRFLPQVSSEVVHRANLAIADVVLDTYPYNGATTTLETLWVGIPLVTRVGLQFSARNSYTMMINAGIMEGIAWTDEEYVEWGVRLGKEEKLRQQISWKLRQSRHTAPLWNAKQFTLDMETAYEQMWQRYIDS